MGLAFLGLGCNIHIRNPIRSVGLCLGGERRNREAENENDREPRSAA
jgi:hypothetical protein